MNGRIVSRSTEETHHLPLPMIGRIKVGEKRTNAGGKEYPASLDYFKASGRYEADFNAVFNEKPQRLPIVFISDDLTVSCYERYECRSQKTGRKTGQSDGVNCMIWDERQGRMVSVKPDDERVAQAGKWKTALTLRFLLPDLKGVLGLWEFTTYGEQSSIPQIRQTFDYILESAGSVQGLPFDLVVEQHKADTGDGARKYPVVSLVCNLAADNIERVRAYVASGGRLPTQVTPKLLEDPEALKPIEYK